MRSPTKRNVPPTDPRNIYAREGEVIMCENGHHVVTMARDVLIGERFFSETPFRDWKQSEPKVGDPLPRCAACDAEWVKDGMVFHFENGGWRDPFQRVADKLRKVDDAQP